MEEATLPVTLCISTDHLCTSSREQSNQSQNFLLEGAYAGPKMVIVLYLYYKSLIFTKTQEP